MKKMILIIAMLWGVAQAQTIGYLRYDTVVVMKNGGNGELKIMNSTRGVTGGVLTNMGNGWGQWVTPAGTTPTWQQTLNATNGNILTQNNDIDTDGTDHDLRFGRNAIFGNITFAVGDNFEVSSAHTAITGTDSISLISAGLIHLRDSSVYGGSATNGYVWTLTDDTDGEGTWKPAAGGGLTVGTTTIDDGTDTRVLFDDAGVLGEDAGLVFNKTTNAITVGGNVGTSGGNVTIGQPFPTASSVRFYHTDLANTSDWLLINKQNGQGIAFYNNDNSAYRMLLQEDGAFRLGGSAYPSVGTSTIVGSNANAVQFPSYGAGTATFDASGNITSVSDERLKKIQGPSKAGLKEICNLVPINYKWNEKSGNERLHTYTGFSAQNVKANIPNGTGVMPDGYLTLQDRAIMAAMVNAIKELKELNDKQQKEIDALKKR